MDDQIKTILVGKKVRGEMMFMEKPLLRADEAMFFLRLSKGKFYENVKAGKIEIRKLDGATYVFADELWRFVGELRKQKVVYQAGENGGKYIAEN